MIFVWIAIYGGVYFLAEYLSDLLGQAHGLTAVALLIYAGALLWWSGRTKEGRFSFSWRPSGMQIAGLTPLLCFPIANLVVGAWGWSFPLAGLMLATCVVEEIFFRGYLRALPTGKKRLLGVFLGSGAFALLHLANLSAHSPAFVAAQVAFAFCAGVCFCGLTLRFNSLLPATLVHLAVNWTGMGGGSLAGWRVCLLAACAVIYLVYGLYFIYAKEKSLGVAKE